MKKMILIFTILLMCLFFMGCKETNNVDDRLINSNDKVVSEEDKVLLDEITKQDFSKFEYISLFGAENNQRLLLTYDKEEINDILSILKLNEQEILYKHSSKKREKTNDYLSSCIRIDFKYENPLSEDSKTSFYVSNEGRLIILILGDDKNRFQLCYTDKNVINYQELCNYYKEWRTNWLHSNSFITFFTDEYLSNHTIKLISIHPNATSSFIYIIENEEDINSVISYFKKDGFFQKKEYVSDIDNSLSYSIGIGVENIDGNEERWTIFISQSGVMSILDRNNNLLYYSEEGCIDVDSFSRLLRSINNKKK